MEGTRRIVDEVLSVMAAAPIIPSSSAQVKQQLIITRLAQRLGLRQETVWARLGELPQATRKERKNGRQNQLKREHPDQCCRR